MIRKANENDFLALTSMPSSSIGQNNYLKDALLKKQISYNECYIFEKEKQLLGRIILESNNEHLSLFTIEDISQEECNLFLEEALRQSQSRHRTTVLYEDKPHFKMIHHALLNHFELRSTRDNLELLKLSPQKTTLQYYNLLEKDPALFIDAMNQTDEGHLDPIHTKGNKHGIDYFNELKETEYNPKSWFLAYRDEQLVGFVIIQNLWEKEMCINYIGVLPQYRGQGYIDDLVKKAIDYSFHQNASKLIAETDLNNFPMRNSLLRNGFEKTQQLNFYIQL